MAKAQIVRPGRVLAGKVLVSFVAVFTAISAHIADWSVSHVFNPAWPPHAKFHNGQTLAFAVIACLACLWFAWRRSGDPRTNAIAAITLAGLYWVTQAAAILYPGTAFFDPGFDDPSLYVFRLPIQVMLEIAALLLLGIAARLWLWPTDHSRAD